MKELAALGYCRLATPATRGARMVDLGALDGALRGHLAKAGDQSGKFLAAEKKRQHYAETSNLWNCFASEAVRNKKCDTDY